MEVVVSQPRCHGRILYGPRQTFKLYRARIIMRDSSLISYGKIHGAT